MSQTNEANQPSLMHRFAEAIKDSHSEKEGSCDSCIVLEAQAYSAEPSPNHDEAIKAFTDSIEHFRNAAKAVSFYVENELEAKDHIKHYTKRVEFYTETADTLETLKNWLEKTK